MITWICKVGIINPSDDELTKFSDCNRKLRVAVDYALNSSVGVNADFLFSGVTTSSTSLNPAEKQIAGQPVPYLEGLLNRAVELADSFGKIEPIDAPKYINLLRLAADIIELEAKDAAN